MNIPTPIVSTDTGYVPGFDNHVATETVAGAPPIGRNSPRQVPFGLYAAQVSGNMFTAPHHGNRRSWPYRVGPAASHDAFVPCACAPFERIQEFQSRLCSTRWAMESPALQPDYDDCRVNFPTAALPK